MICRFNHYDVCCRGKKEGRSDYASALENLCQTYSLLRTYPDGEQSLLPPPVRIRVARGVVGDRALAPTTYVDRVDLTVGSASGVIGIGYALTRRRVGRVVVVRGVVSDVELAPAAYVDGEDLFVGSGPLVALVSDPLAGRRVGRIVVTRGVVG